MIEDSILTERSKDPVEIAERLMAQPDLPMLSCDHALVAAGALMAALRNSPYGSWLGEKEVREVFDRISKQSSVSLCGLTGVCGIVPAMGSAVSRFLDSGAGSDREQKLAMEAAGRAGRVIMELTGPACCKAYVRAAIADAVEFFGEKFGIILPVQKNDIVCSHADKHPQGCREEKCPYFRKPARDVFAEAGFHPGMTSCVT